MEVVQEQIATILILPNIQRCKEAHCRGGLVGVGSMDVEHGESSSCNGNGGGLISDPGELYPQSSDSSDEPKSKVSSSGVRMGITMPKILYLFWPCHTSNVGGVLFICCYSSSFIFILQPCLRKDSAIILEPSTSIC